MDRGGGGQVSRRGAEDVRRSLDPRMREGDASFVGANRTRPGCYFSDIFCINALSRRFLPSSESLLSTVDAAIEA
jgi:hypothetical protein